MIPDRRHGEERGDEAIQIDFLLTTLWMASPPARHDASLEP